jgi:hypothetical protein
MPLPGSLVAVLPRGDTAAHTQVREDMLYSSSYSNITSPCQSLALLDLCQRPLPRDRERPSAFQGDQLSDYGWPYSRSGPQVIAGSRISSSKVRAGGEDVAGERKAMKHQVLLCWASAVLLSLLPLWGFLDPGSGIQICAYLHTAGGYTGPDVLAVGFVAMSTFLPAVLAMLTAAVWRSSHRRLRFLTWIGVGAALMTAAYYALSVVMFFSPYCPSGSQGLWFVLLLYGGIAALLIAGTLRSRRAEAGAQP